VRYEEVELNKHNGEHCWVNDWHNPDDEAVSDTARFVDEWAEEVGFPTSFSHDACADVVSALRDFADDELGDRVHWERAMGPVALGWIKRVTACDLDNESKVARIALLCGTSI
jgi:hypothetical protein